MNSYIDEVLSKIYNDPSNPASFSTSRALWKAANKSFPLHSVEEWLQNQDAYTLHKPTRKRFTRNRYVIDNIDDLWQADLNDMASIKQHNNGYVYLLTVIDVFSKFAWSIPLKRKTGSEVSAAFKKIFNKSGRKPLNLETDKGKEFLNKVFQKFLKENDVHFYHTHNPDIKACIVERFNRTLKSKMWRYFTMKNTYRYVSVLPKLMYAYNHTRHRSIRMAPSEVHDGNVREVWYNLNGMSLAKKKIIPKFKIEDFVRISKEKIKFDKSYDQGWSEEIFKIKFVIPRQPVVYRIEDLHQEEIEGTFYEKELQKVTYQNKSDFKIDKIVETKGKGIRKKVLVKWKGYPSKFNSWVLWSDISKI